MALRPPWRAPGHCSTRLGIGPTKRNVAAYKQLLDLREQLVEEAEEEETLEEVLMVELTKSEERAVLRRFLNGPNFTEREWRPIVRADKGLIPALIILFCGILAMCGPNFVFYYQIRKEAALRRALDIPATSRKE